MNHNNFIRESLEQNLSGLYVSRQQQMDMIDEIVGGRKMKRKISFSIALVAILILTSVTALAVGVLRYSPRQDMRIQARSLLNTEYGMTEDILALFNETVTVEGTDWEVNYELPVYGQQAGSYRVVCENGKMEAFWSHDGKTYALDGDLSDDIWGVSQLERMQKLYQTRAEEIEYWKRNGGYDSLSIEQKAKIDEPLLELPHSVDFIHIAPQGEDIQPEEAEKLAREEILRRFGGDAAALEECECRISFMLVKEVRRYDLQFLKNGQVQYHVRMISPEGRIVECRCLDLQGVTPDEAEAWDDSAMSIEDRAALHEQMRGDGGDERRWNSVLPEMGDISEEEALRIAQEALLEQFGVSAEKLVGMEQEIYCRMDYENFDIPTKVWWIRYVDSVDDYQVTLQADGGTVENISNQGDIFGVG